ncbi:MAG: phospholipase D-like domain-containing protein [Methanolinea sp.]|nr:phospholipase D-like domain-containing protein [Methanolinea sp.]
MYWQPALVAFLLVMPVAGISLVEVCPDPYLPGDRDEYFCLEGDGLLDGIMVTDGEGSVRFPPGSHLGSRVVVAMDAEAYQKSHGTYPDYEWDGDTPAVPDMIRVGRFQLANAKDEVSLYRGQTLLQQVEWPGMVEARQGQVHFLSNGTWDPRVLMLGQSRFSPQVFEGARGIAFVSPDCSRGAFLSAVAGAEREILVAVYEFTSPPLAGSLISASGRGVDVRVLLEGGPVGGIPPEEKWVISRLAGGGIPVFTMSGTADVHVPYRYMHAKYMVIDGTGVLVTSENFKGNGFPPEGKQGNRGWGVVISHPGVAEYFGTVFSHDAGGSWAVRAVPGPGKEEAPTEEDYSPKVAPLEFSGATVVPVLSPDTSSLLHDLIRGARESIDIEMAYITNETGDTPNPFLADAVDAARRGVSVRVLLDSYYYNIEGSADNDEMVAFINAIAAGEKIPLEARCARIGAGQIEKVHTKGVIVDRKKTLIGSINWNRNSPTFNREAAVIVDHPGVGAYFTTVFDNDWTAAGKGGPRPGPDLQKIAIALAAIVAIVILFRYGKKRR